MSSQRPVSARLGFAGTQNFGPPVGRQFATSLKGYSNLQPPKCCSSVSNHTLPPFLNASEIARAPNLNFFFFRFISALSPTELRTLLPLLYQLTSEIYVTA